MRIVLRMLSVAPALWCAVLLLTAFVHGAAAQDKPKIEITPQLAHSSGINAVAFSPDGKLLLSGGADRTLKLWDAATGRLIRTYRGHSEEVFAVAFSPDGTRLLSSSWDMIKLWDTATGRPIATLDESDHRVHQVRSVAFSPDGMRLLSGSGDKTLKLWDAGNGKLVRTFEGHTGQVTSVAFSPDGTRLLSGSGDSTLGLWDAATGQLIRTIKGHSGWVRSVAFSPDGTRVLSGDDKTLKLWDAASGKLIRSFEANSISAVAFSPDGTRLLSASLDKTIKLWEPGGKLIRTFNGHGDRITSVAFSPDGTRLLSGSWDATVKLWDALSGQAMRTLQKHAAWIQSIAVSPDGTLIVAGGGDKTLKLWDATGQPIRTFVGHGDHVTSVAFSPDGTRLLSGSADNTIKLWDTRTGQLKGTMHGHGATVRSVAFSHDGTRLLSGGFDRTVKLWDAGTGKLIRTLRSDDVQSAAVLAVSFSPDGSRVLSGNNDGTLTIWDAASGRRMHTMKDGHYHGVTSVAFSPDGTRLVSGNSSSTVNLWDTASGQLIRTNTGHRYTVSSVAYSPDGTRVLSGAGDATIKLWDAATSQLIRTFEGHIDGVKSVAFSSDGRRVISGGNDTSIRIWDSGNGSPIAAFFADRGGDWLAMTAAGFFTGSREVNKLLGIVRGLELTTIGQVHQSLFNPDLVREALAGDSNGEVQEAAKVINLERVVDSGPAPVLAIMLPAEASQSASDLATVTAHIEDRGKGVGRIEWRVNGITAAVAAKPRGDGPAYTVTQQLALDPGDNTIEVVAYNASNLLASLPASTTIKFTGRADQTRAKLHILAIGINDYVDRGWAPPGSVPLAFAPLGLAVKDAQAFGASMKRAAAGLFEEVRVTLALDQDATRENLGTIVDALAAEIHPRDSFILFAAGHGTSENGRFYLIPQDYQSGPGNLARHAIGQDRLQDWLANPHQGQAGDHPARHVRVGRADRRAYALPGGLAGRRSCSRATARSDRAPRAHGCRCRPVRS